MEEEVYSNIRQILGHAIGQTIVDITQHDRDEFDEDGYSYVMLMLSHGGYIKFFIEDSGFVDNDGASESE